MVHVMNISELSPDQSNVSVEAEVIAVEEPREVNTKFGTTVELNVATIKDESGEIKLTLWGEQAKGIEVGKKIKISGAFVKEFKGEKQLSLTRQGKIEFVK